MDFIFSRTPSTSHEPYWGPSAPGKRKQLTPKERARRIARKKMAAASRKKNRK